MRDTLLAIHILCGTAGLALGPVAMAAPKRHGRHTTAGIGYQAATAGLCVTAIGLVTLKPSLWWLGLIALGTEAAAAGGWVIQRRRPPGWLPWHVSLMCGSYVSFVTAFLVVNTSGIPAAWIAPTVIGTPLIALAARRAARNSSRPVSSARP
ncbi:MAG: hypothetical protein M3Y91_15995 [Actinomycetota bacterium]|nr:hypothetical protein [Actinomycetota bacterium]